MESYKKIIKSLDDDIDRLNDTIKKMKDLNLLLNAGNEK